MILLSAYNWVFDFDPSFPIHLFEYRVPGRSDRLHWHHYYEIGLCTEGSGRFLYAGKEYAAQPGDLFITNNYETHVAVTEAPLQRYVFLIFLPSLFADSPLGQTLNRQYLQTFRYDPLRFNNRISSGSNAAQALAKSMREALIVYSQRPEGWQMRVDILTREILLCLHDVYAAGEADAADSIRISRRMLTAREYINANYSQHLTVDEVAQAAGMNPSYFRHAFKEVFQVSFKEYVTQLRLAQAQLAFSQTGENINRIIEDLGYTNVTQFYRIFKKYTNMTPAEYRRLHSR